MKFVRKERLYKVQLNPKVEQIVEGRETCGVDVPVSSRQMDSDQIHCLIRGM